MNQNYEAFVRSYVEQEAKHDPSTHNYSIYIYSIICIGFILLGISTFSNVLPATLCTIVSIIGTLMSSLVLIVFWDLYQKTLKTRSLDEITDVSQESGV
ncbi:hypothetical protein TVAG_200910 [Trichomonas vaginalis G3]|uniref:Uncharacterized protein n=1 Tax=Trichomonas vaginalis (strain ATCC PRA-98 / G3) TaxID=412133 RepID=A2FVT7_TRIV3|nr:hypothetical protein TVAGG3_0533320 [Trichomonas vaginalis G3]EAX90990.1 hypothetical protein TVAG_200910 [Trichomonas vaginalis G3]KAI5519311.1 hypothetical protein TVAGG3_0533320 [Trichomonas vaginalis G3]|eukprot:XP_001303920.1 hypothetical protein [Trichomonas vaginalis G3]